jgi:hypothetical protein
MREALKDGAKVLALMYGPIAGGVLLWMAVCVVVGLLSGAP